MADVRPILEYGQPPQRRAVRWQTLAALPPLVFSSMTVCTCGHMGWVSLPFTLGALSLSWWGFARRTPSRVWRLLVIVMVALSSLAFTKNAADMLWYGHEPLLRSAK